jgi:DinB family protein
MTASRRIEELIEAYADGPRLLEAAVAGILPDEMRFSPGPDHWSIHENVVHVADTELVGTTRMRYVIAQPGSTLVSFDQEQWARALDYRSRSLDAALAQFRAVRRTTADILRAAPAEAWEQIGVNTEAGPQTLEWLVRRFAEHVPYHLRTIAKRRDQYARARREG